MTNLTVAELRARAKAKGIKNYSKLNKKQLVETLYPVAETVQEELIVEFEAPVQTTLKAPEFDYKRYLGFNPTSAMVGQCITAGQDDLAKSLMINYKVSIDTASCKDRYTMSVKLNNVLNAIHAGKVAKRSDAEILAKLEGYKHSDKPQASGKASSAQIELINKLEKELNIVVTDVINSSAKASEVIKRLLAEKKKAAVQQVAVTNAERFASSSFRTKFQAMMKKIFA